MLGGFRHRPNKDSILIMKKLWYRIRSQLPYAELHIYGIIFCFSCFSAFVSCCCCCCSFGFDYNTLLGSYPLKEDLLLTDSDNGFIVKGIDLAFFFFFFSFFNLVI
jgi:hypothetical protein